MQPSPLAAGPTGAVERISALDALRGFALLGILLMNIVGMGTHFAAYDNPLFAGKTATANIATWAAMHILAEGKMRALFSMLFGAGVVLMTARLDSRGAGSADVYYRRTIWLLLFGIAHAYLLWGGDILYPYALCALILYPFRVLPAKTLLIGGGIWLALTSAYYIKAAYDTRDLIEKSKAAIAAEKAGAKLTPEQEEAKHGWEEMRKHRLPTAAELEASDTAWRGGFWSAVKQRAKNVAHWHAAPYYSPWNWDIWGMMLLGMGLLKAGVITGERPMRLYVSLAAGGYLIGLPLNSVTAWIRINSNFDLVTGDFTAVAYDLGRLAVATGHMAMLMILVKSGAMRWLTSRLAAVGQMALSNYIFHSVVTMIYFCMTGMYGRLERFELYYVVGAIWAVQLVASPIWLRHFQYGPMEWVWRSLTYWQRQRMKAAQCHHAPGVS